MAISAGSSMTLWLFFYSIVLITSLASVNGQLINPSNPDCVCPDQVLTYTCAAEGSGSTLWNGTAFVCIGNEIILRHSRFTEVNGASGECNDGNIIASSLRVEGSDNMVYVSQLNVTVSVAIHNKSVACLLRMIDGTIVPIGESPLIFVASVVYQQPPQGVRLSSVDRNALTFSWIPVESSCSFNNTYNITSSQCGTCAIATTTTVTCSNPSLSSVCVFSIQNIVCGQVGMPSNPLIVNLRVPNMPILREIIPIYSVDDNALTGFKVTVNQEASFNITDSVPGSITDYNITYSGTQIRVPSNSSCMQGVCEFTVSVSLSHCKAASSIVVTLSAMNILGPGPPLDSVPIGCTNDFVEVKYHSATSSITCQFLNETDISIKSCSVMYGQCGQLPYHSIEGNTTMEFPNVVSLNVLSSRINCYNVTARSDTITVIIEAKGISSDVRNLAVILIPVLVVVIVILIVMLIIVGVVLKKAVHRRNLKQPDMHTRLHQPILVEGQEMHEVQDHNGKQDQNNEIQAANIAIESAGEQNQESKTDLPHPPGNTNDNKLNGKKKGEESEPNDGSAAEGYDHKPINFGKGKK